MSVDVYVVACREITEDDMVLIQLYNGLIEVGMDLPDKLVTALKSILGKDSFYAGEPIRMPPNSASATRTVEIMVKGEGDVMYGDGMLIRMEDLPPNTIALRIYSEA